jgi:biopolymer transport protein ExbD
MRLPLSVAAIASFALNLAHAQTSVTIHISSNGTCDIASAEVACNDVGNKLLSMHVPAGSVINLQGDPDLRYKPVAAVASSLKASGYRTKIAHITTDGG